MMRHTPVLVAALLLAVGSNTTIYAQKTTLERVHENIRETPYPQSFHHVYINPAPLLPPKSMKTADMLQFQLSQDADFNGDAAMTSEPKPWCMFNPHKILDKGEWYWRVRPVNASGQTGEWSETFGFSITGEEPQFVTPPFETFRAGLPTG